MAINNDIFFLFKENGLNENLGLAVLDYYENYEFIEIVKNTTFQMRKSKYLQT